MVGDDKPVRGDTGSILSFSSTNIWSAAIIFEGQPRIRAAYQSEILEKLWILNNKTLERGLGLETQLHGLRTGMCASATARVLLPPCEFVFFEPIIATLVFVHSICLTAKSDLILVFSAAQFLCDNFHMFRLQESTFLDGEADVVPNVEFRIQLDVALSLT